MSQRPPARPNGIGGRQSEHLGQSLQDARLRQLQCPRPNRIESLDLYPVLEIGANSPVQASASVVIRISVQHYQPRRSPLTALAATMSQCASRLSSDGWLPQKPTTLSALPLPIAAPMRTDLLQRLVVAAFFFMLTSLAAGESCSLDRGYSSAPSANEQWSDSWDTTAPNPRYQAVRPSFRTGAQHDGYG